mmetsp:Transcript_9086/g.15614  ORF Transcript_9086/g.15614 Transcript_9086/m.15614 type:complete len:616 (+) Transcript_9086:395-2242(+)|eukprot:CAMPEP_0198201152 /NCGR_PEP_ID=MMETSP1445-20131203/3932_1 /TAXON_ID=36898 /ORGANISM="Pyramimonas sp., Strain CCMP2087" /LENGTH=615 /DNA_ID=CAMNT_0043871347 /DNA_START=397 /DNA_END=2244 /DNA_ORIENTATION=-
MAPNQAGKKNSIAADVIAKLMQRIGDPESAKKVITLASVQDYMRKETLSVAGGKSALELMFHEADYKNTGKLTRDDLKAALTNRFVFRKCNGQWREFACQLLKTNDISNLDKDLGKPFRRLEEFSSLNTPMDPMLLPRRGSAWADVPKNFTQKPATGAWKAHVDRMARIRERMAGETKVEHVATASGKMSLVPAAHEHALNQANGLNKRNGLNEVNDPKLRTRSLCEESTRPDTAPTHSTRPRCRSTQATNSARHSPRITATLSAAAHFQLVNNAFKGRENFSKNQRRPHTVAAATPSEVMHKRYKHLMREAGKTQGLNWAPESTGRDAKPRYEVGLIPTGRRPLIEDQIREGSTDLKDFHGDYINPLIRNAPFRRPDTNRPMWQEEKENGYKVRYKKGAAWWEKEKCVGELVDTRSNYICEHQRRMSGDYSEGNLTALKRAEVAKQIIPKFVPVTKVDPAELELPKYRLHHPPRHPNLHNPLSEPPETMYQQALMDRAVTPAKFKKPVSRESDRHAPTQERLAAEEETNSNMSRMRSHRSAVSYHSASVVRMPFVQSITTDLCYDPLSGQTTALASPGKEITLDVSRRTSGGVSYSAEDSFQPPAFDSQSVADG